MGCGGGGDGCRGEGGGDGGSVGVRDGGGSGSVPSDGGGFGGDVGCVNGGDGDGDRGGGLHHSHTTLPSPGFLPKHTVTDRM